MDSKLLERLKKDEQIDHLRIMEKRYLGLQAHEKVMYSQLFLKASGSNIEERKAKVYSSIEWQDFASGLVVAETDYLEAKRRYELKLKAYDAEHLTLKTEAPAIRRQL